MSTEKNFIGAKPPITHSAMQIHVHAFYSLIEDFFDFSPGYELHKQQNEMILVFLEKVLDPSENYDKEYIENAINTSQRIAEFVTELNARWENYKYFTELQIPA